MTGNNFQIESAAISDRGLSEKRPQNEDSYLELNKQGLFAVADGVGGAQAGDVASQMAMEILGEAFINLRRDSDAEETMQIAIERANEAIFQMSHDLAQLSTMATTIVALHIAGNIASIGHVGDSRLYRLDPKGNFYRETQDHSMVEEEVRAGRMTPEQALHHPSRNVISRALGAEQTVEVDLKTIMIEPETVFLICSDGVTRHIDDFQLRELILYKDAPDNICRRIREICYERGAEDNLTAVIARVTARVAEEIIEPITAAPVELEEATVAAARPIPVAVEEIEQPEMPTQEIRREEIPYPIVENNFATVRDADKNRTTTANEIVENRTSSAEKPLEKSSGSNFLHLILLLTGLILGAGAYYLWARANAQTNLPPATTVQAPIPHDEFSAFENSRRGVDGDPNAFINASVNMPLTAENYYLLGRAFLLTEKYPEAKKSFEDAKNKLAQSNAANNKVLATDIALGLAVIDEAAAQNKFQSQIKPVNAETDINSNLNTNKGIR